MTRTDRQSNNLSQRLLNPIVLGTIATDARNGQETKDQQFDGHRKFVFKTCHTHPYDKTGTSEKKNAFSSILMNTRVGRKGGEFLS